MLTLMLGAQTSFDDVTGRFTHVGGTPLTLQHSLVSLSKWESKWERSFLSDPRESDEEVLDYIRCMIVSDSPTAVDLSLLTAADLEAVNELINAKQSATTFAEVNRDRGSKRITSEEIYGWMVSLQIDWQAQYWHFNRLMTLIRVVNLNNLSEKDKKAQRVTGTDALAQRRALNAKRRAESGSRG